MDFTFYYTQTRHTIETSPFTCWSVKNSSLVTTTTIVAKQVGRFGNLGPACTRDLSPPLRKYLGDYS